MRSLFVCVLLLSISGSRLFVAGQEQRRGEKSGTQSVDSKSANDQIEVKEDRFSGVTTVKLKPQVILDKPEHQLTIRSETKLGDKNSFEWRMDTVSAYVWLESHYNQSVDYGDRELHLMIDGKPLNLDKLTGGAPSKSTLNTGYRLMSSFVAILDDRSKLEQISKGKNIEMRFGTIEVTLTQPVVAALREYANRVLIQDKIVRGRKP